MPERDRILGALILGGTADALGWRTEFWHPGKKRQPPVTQLETWRKRVGRVGGYWAEVEAGDYSDDTQLTLAAARCVSPEGTYDADRFARVELPYWLSYQRGGGRTTKRAAANLLANPNLSWDSNEFDGYNDSGANGAAMRVLPLATISDRSRATIATWQNAITTHGHPRAIVGALTMTWALTALLHARDILSPSTYFQNLRDSLRSATLDLPDEKLRRWIAAKSEAHDFARRFTHARDEMLRMLDAAMSSIMRPDHDVLDTLGCLNQSTKGSGTATVAAGNYLFLKYHENPETAVVRAANALGSDTDTIGTFAGNLLGALHGRTAYTGELSECLQDRLYFHRIADYLSGAKEERHWNGVKGDETELTPDTREGDVYYSSVLGFGEVMKVSPPKRVDRGTATLLEVKVMFECGQSCYFNKRLPFGARQVSLLSPESEQRTGQARGGRRVTTRSRRQQ